MRNKDIKDVVDCLDYLKEKLDRIENKQNTTIDKVNYIMSQTLGGIKEIKARLNGEYGYKKTVYLNVYEIKKRIPAMTFDLFINDDIVLRECKLSELDIIFEMYTDYRNISKYHLDKVTNVLYRPYSNEVSIYTDESEEG